MNKLLEKNLENCGNISSEESLKRYIDKIFQYPNLSAEEELKTAKEAHEGSIEAKQKLINANLKLAVITVLKLAHTNGMSAADLIQEGIIGLIAAADKFNWKYGYRFSSYAVWRVRQAVYKAVSEQAHSFKIPVYIQETLSRYSKMKAEIEKSTGRTAGLEETAQKLNISPDKIDNYFNAYKKTIPLESSYELQNGSEVQLSDIIEDKKSSVSERLERENFKKDIEMLITKLKDREKKVITLRFGLNGGERQTLENIGRLYGVTKECIRQTETRALNKLKKTQEAECIYADYLS